MFLHLVYFSFLPLWAETRLTLHGILHGIFTELHGCRGKCNVNLASRGPSQKLHESLRMPAFWNGGVKTTGKAWKNHFLGSTCFALQGFLRRRSYMYIYIYIYIYYEPPLIKWPKCKRIQVSPTSESKWVQVNPNETPSEPLPILLSNFS